MEEYLFGSYYVCRGTKPKAPAAAAYQPRLLAAE
jgi:hypothetical protein